MPDKHGFDHLGVLGDAPSVRCIYCPEGGPLAHWPEPLRARHARTHRKATQQAAEAAARERALLEAASPTELQEDDDMADEQVQCPHCDKQVSKSNLRRHVKTQHPDAEQQQAPAAEGEAPAEQPHVEGLQELNDLMAANREGYLAYERAHLGAKQGKVPADEAAATKAEHAEAHKVYWRSYEKRRALLKAAEAATA